MNRKILLTAFVISYLTCLSAEARSWHPGGEIRNLAEDGAWCWFSDPRAVYYQGVHERTYVGYVTSDGDIKVSFYDHQDEEKKEVVIYPEFQRDDHVNPSLLFLPDGRLSVFFTGHNGGFYFTRTKSPEDISRWEDISYLDLGPRLCYTNPVLLSAENNRIYVYLRGGNNWKPVYIFSDDLGETWSEPRTIVAHEGSPDSNRPYTKVATDGTGRVWFAITDGHPNVEPFNSVYVFYYERDNFYQVDGSLIGSAGEYPLVQGDIMKAYDGVQTKVRSWIWDLAVDENGYPRIAYTRLREETRHIYYYASWNGSSWEHSLISQAGQDFTREERTKEQHNREPFYSGGVVLDPDKEGIVYYSRPVGDRFEIFRGEFSEGEWNAIQITSRSEYDNVRPFVARNSTKGDKRVLFWMSNRMYRHYTEYDSALMMYLY